MDKDIAKNILNKLCKTYLVLIRCVNIIWKIITDLIVMLTKCLIIINLKERRYSYVHIKNILNI